jgi:altronate dehydratase small subunit
MRKPMESKDNKKIKDNKIIEENKEIKEAQKNKEYRVFQIDEQDNVATALEEIPGGGIARVIGDHPAGADKVKALEEIPEGHKIALRAIAKEAPVIKYNVVIGVATRDIPAGSWVHMHVMKSRYDERSSHLDAVTGAPKDTVYE